MKKALYNIGAVLSTIFLIGTGVSESEAMKIIPDYEETNPKKANKGEHVLSH